MIESIPDGRLFVIRTGMGSAIRRISVGRHSYRKTTDFLHVCDPTGFYGKTIFFFDIVLNLRITGHSQHPFVIFETIVSLTLFKSQYGFVWCDVKWCEDWCDMGEKTVQKVYPIQWEI